MLYKYSIYAAEDDLDDHVLIREAFEENNIHANITFFQNGEELLKGLSQASELPTMVMSDLQMPAKDGFEVLMEIKKNPAWQDLPVIIFSNSNRAENIVKAYSLGATLFVVKPVTYNELVFRIESIHRLLFRKGKVALKSNPAVSRSSSAAVAR
jgi:CheY-like chemotaxis protein